MSPRAELVRHYIESKYFLGLKFPLVPFDHEKCLELSKKVYFSQRQKIRICDLSRENVPYGLPF